MSCALVFRSMAAKDAPIQGRSKQRGRSRLLYNRESSKEFFDFSISVWVKFLFCFVSSRDPLFSSSIALIGLFVIRENSNCSKRSGRCKRKRSLRCYLQPDRSALKLVPDERRLCFAVVRISYWILSEKASKPVRVSVLHYVMWQKVLQDVRCGLISVPWRWRRSKDTWLSSL